MTRDFDLVTVSAPDGAVVIAVEGELDMLTAPELKARLFAVIGVHAPGKIVVDLTDCEFVDSTALAAFVQARNALDGDRVRLALVISSPSILRVFGITQLDHVFAIYPDRASALGSVRPAGDSA
ncbi:MAG TPA: STAS domain-containing protein [Gaiellaceae bacterium]|nr:STAS domain-containing protein [Gaiellaceae bacterium]